MDFNDLDEEVLELIKNPKLPIPDYYEWFFDQYGEFTYGKRVRFKKTYDMWCEAIKTGKKATEMAVKYKISIPHVYNTFREFGMSYPTRNKGYRKAIATELLYETLFEVIEEDKVYMIDELREILASDERLRNQYTLTDVVYIYTTLKHFSPSKLKSLKKKLSKL